MTDNIDRQHAIEAIVENLQLPQSVTIRAWTEADFAAVQRLSAKEGWPTPTEPPAAALHAWRTSWPALVATAAETVVGFLRALSDGAVTTDVAELLIATPWRGRGIGSALLLVAQRLDPDTRIDLLATAESEAFYARAGFRPFAGFRRWLPKSDTVL